jgi:hypothetical protein
VGVCLVLGAGEEETGEAVAGTTMGLGWEVVDSVVQGVVAVGTLGVAALEVVAGSVEAAATTVVVVGMEEGDELAEEGAWSVCEWRVGRV